MTGLSKSISPFVELHKKPEAVYKNYDPLVYELTNDADDWKMHLHGTRDTLM